MKTVCETSWGRGDFDLGLSENVRNLLTIFPVLVTLIMPEATLVTNWNAVISCEYKTRRLGQRILNAPSGPHVPGF